MKLRANDLTQMNPNFERAELLYHQGRYDLAEESLRRALADDPDFAMAHGLLALCLLQRKNLKEATEAAERAVGLAPDLPFAHYVLACTLLERNRLSEAEEAVKQAIELNPYDADLHMLLGNIFMNQRRWTAALDEADEGLRLDPEHGACANLRAMALVKLGRKDEADRVMEGVLARDPEDAFSHANQGWTALNQNDPKKALEHFREALRLDPTQEYALHGMVEALKARYLVYRLMLRWFLFMQRLSVQTQWIIIIGLVVLNRVLRGIAENNPDLAPFVWPVLGVLIGFVVLTWLAGPLFNLLLRLNRYGRHALSREQKLEANCVGICLLAAVGALAYGLIDNHITGILLTIYFAVLLLPISGVFKAPWGWPRFVLATAAVILAGIGLYGIWIMDSAIGQPMAIARGIIADGEQFLTIYFIGCALSTFATNILASVQIRR